MDPSGKPTGEKETTEPTASEEEVSLTQSHVICCVICHMICHVINLMQDRAAGDRLLASPDKHKVIVCVEKQQELGFSLRGGKEFSLGIFISQ